MKNNILCSFFILLLLADLAYSFRQHLSQPLDGDMAWNIVPADEVKPILASPFGTAVIRDHQSYPNPNRFFCHYTMKKYFESVPQFLQRFVPPVESVYLSCAIAKIIIQLLLILLLATAITGTFRIFSTDFLMAAILVTPFFQTEGYQSYMGIIDRATTYTFFYALPFLFLLLYFSPFLQQYYHNRKPAFPGMIYFLWIPLAIVVCLSGPLNPGIALILSLLLFLDIVHKNYARSDQSRFSKRLWLSVAGIPGNYWFWLVPVCLFSLYSLYIGRYNSNNIPVPLGELYSRLPAGLYYPLTKKLGFPVLILAIVLNYLIIGKKYRTAEGKKIVNIIRWLCLFILLYILLLPLGGFRNNRPNVLRYDTLLPVTISLVCMFGITVFFLLKNLPKQQKNWYIATICGVLLFFTINDEKQFDKNRCEIDALKKISQSASPVVPIPGDCCVLSWGKMTNPEYSRLNARLLEIWNITKEEKLYYNE
jgi:hypothetical protein